MAYIKRPFPRKGVDWNRINKEKEKEMTDKTRQELNEVYDRLERTLNYVMLIIMTSFIIWVLFDIAYTLLV
jgi:hypothetical protein